jgi:hypothetical protein
MSKTVMKTFASRSSSVQVVQWTEDPDVFHFLQGWTGNRVRMGGDSLILQTPDLVESVPLGHSIVRVGDDAFHVFNPKDLQELYVRVGE